VRGIFKVCAVFCGVFYAREATASVAINIDLSSQTMHVSSRTGTYDWRISTARSGYRTPRGSYRPYLLLRMHYSQKYDLSPMPYSIFFAGGYAIHGTYSTGSLGRPASHGCIRLAPAHAALLFSMVKAEGGRISIHGSPPAASYGTLSAAYHSKHHALAYAPARHVPAVRVWQANPAMNPLPEQWPDWQ